MRALLDLILPPLCPLCRTIVPQKSTVCPSCWQQLNFIAPPFCSQCSLPFEISTPEEDLALQKCGTCLQSPPTFLNTRCTYVYDEVSKKMVLSFKHGNALYIAPFLAQGLLNIGSDLLRTADLILPVPLHWRRLYNRGFNQAAVVAQHLGKISHKPVSVNILKRIQNTPFQGNLSLEERIKNVAHCFKVSKPQKIKNKSILLVDDVMTTGATLNACAKTLLKVGAKEINVLCVARVKAVQ